MKTLDELRDSSYHQELGQKLWAAYVAQQQGISMASAFKLAEGRVSDAWLMVAELALLAHESCIGHTAVQDRTDPSRLVLNPKGF